VQQIELGLVDRTIDRAPVDMFLTGGFFHDKFVVRRAPCVLTSLAYQWPFGGEMALGPTEGFFV
jgi:hypothetical protein